MEDDYTVEEVDALTGPLIGLPNSASFRLLDIVGLDVWAFVGSNLYHAVPERSLARSFPAARFREEDDRAQMARRQDRPGLLQTRRQGREQEIHALDWKTLEYHPLQKPRFPSVEAARNIEDLGERLRTLLRSDDRAGQFLWKVFSDLFLYSAEMIPEISDRIVEIDRAMRWGYAQQAGAVRAVGRARIRGRDHAAGNGTPRAAAERQEMRSRAA